MTRVLHMRGDVAGMFLFFFVFFLGSWQLLVAWHRLNGLSLTGYPDRRCLSLVLGAVLVASSCSWYFSAPGHFASPDVEGMETLLLLVAGLISATAAEAVLATAVHLLRTRGARRVPPVVWGEDIEVEIGGDAVPGRFMSGSAQAGPAPVLLLHDYGGRASDLGELASALAARGHASLAIDLDGHGGNRRGISSAAMSELLRAASDELRRRAGGAGLLAAGVGLGGALAVELYRSGDADRVFAIDPPARDSEGAPLVNSLRELGPIEVARSFFRPPARRIGGGRVSLSGVVKELPEPGPLEPGKVVVAGTSGTWFNSPELLEEWVRGLGLPGILRVAATHNSIARDRELLEASVKALS